MTEAKVFKGEMKYQIQADVSMLKEENKVKEASAIGCSTVEGSDTKASCFHENVCYAIDIFDIAVDAKPSNPVNCFVKNEVYLPSEGNSSLIVHRIFVLIWFKIRKMHPSLRSQSNMFSHFAFGFREWKFSMQEGPHKFRNKQSCK